MIKTGFKSPIGVPIQPVFGKRRRGRVVLFPEFVKGLKDLEGFSHIYLLYHFDRHRDYQLVVKPYLDKRLHGLFATRAPKRPNGIGLSIVEIVSIRGNILRFRGVDILDNTPLLDIKPYIAEFDRVDAPKSGWYGRAKSRANAVSDGRF